MHLPKSVEKSVPCVRGSVSGPSQPYIEYSSALQGQPTRTLPRNWLNGQRKPSSNVGKPMKTSETHGRPKLGTSYRRVAAVLEKVGELGTNFTFEDAGNDPAHGPVRFARIYWLVQRESSLTYCHLSILGPTLAQNRPKTGSKPQKTKTKMIIVPRGLSASKLRIHGNLEGLPLTSASGTASAMLPLLCSQPGST